MGPCVHHLPDRQPLSGKPAGCKGRGERLASGMQDRIDVTAAERDVRQDQCSVEL